MMRPAIFAGGLAFLLAILALPTVESAIKGHVSPSVAAEDGASAPVIVRTVTYGAHKLPADIYVSRANSTHGAHPAVLLIHGGGWSAGSRVEFADVANLLARQGVMAISIDYRLIPAARWPAQGEDVEEAMWWMGENAALLGIDPNRIAVIGGSAGAHLAGWLATSDRRSPTGTPSRPTAVISLWGPWDLTASRDTLSQDANNIIDSLVVNSDRRNASPYFRINANTAPTLMFHGEKDALVPSVQSTSACSAIKAAGASCELVLFAEEGHDIKHPENARILMERMAAFLKQRLGS